MSSRRRKSSDVGNLSTSNHSQSSSSGFHLPRFHLRRSTVDKHAVAGESQPLVSDPSQTAGGGGTFEVETISAVEQPSVGGVPAPVSIAQEKLTRPKPRSAYGGTPEVAIRGLQVTPPTPLTEASAVEKQEGGEEKNDVEDNTPGSATLVVSEGAAADAAGGGERAKLTQGMSKKEIKDAEKEAQLARWRECNVLPEEEDALVELRKRGLLAEIVERNPITGRLDVALSLSPKLLGRLAIKAGIPRREDASAYSMDQRRIIASEALKVIERSELAYEACFLLHDAVALAGVKSRLTGLYLQDESLPERVTAYFGSGVGLYFLWLRYYTRALRLPAIVGLALWVQQLMTAHICCNTWLAPIFCLVVALWGATFEQKWNQQAAEAGLRWGTLGVEDEETLQDLASAAGLPASRSALRYALSGVVMVSFIAGDLFATVRILNLAVSQAESQGWLALLIVVGYGFLTLVLSNVIKPVVSLLTKVESHKTRIESDNSSVYKMFSLEMVNQFGGLVYTAFVLRDLRLLTRVLLSVFIVQNTFNILLEVVLPLLRGGGDKSAAAPKKEEEVEPLLPGVLATDVEAGLAVISEEKVAEEKDEQDADERILLLGDDDPESIKEFQWQMAAEDFEASDEYLEMALQFGFCTCFSVAFPPIIIFAFLNNFFEFKSDLDALLGNRRPTPTIASNIGSWSTCFRAITLMSTVTNSLLISLYGDELYDVLPAGLSKLEFSTEGRILTAVILEHLIILIWILIRNTIPDMPLQVRQAQAKLTLEERHNEEELRVKASGGKAAERESEADRLRSVALNNLREMKREKGLVSLSPIYFVFLVLLPLILGLLNISLWYSLPIAFLYLGYLQNQKNKAEMGLALGIVKDPQLIKLISSEMPKWFVDSDVETMEWLNAILDRFWVPATGAVNEIIKTEVAPLLEEAKPPGITQLAITELNLGSAAPHIVGIRTLGMVKGAVVVDVEVKWSSNMKVVVQVGRKGMPLSLTLKNVQFSGHLRAELSPLVPKVPCFGAIAITFLKKPFVDFSFKVGSLDVMSVGPGDMSVGATVSNIIKSVIQDLMLYPKKLVIPVMEETDIRALANPAPVGVVSVTIIGAKDLAAFDVGGTSDPYVVIKLGPESAKTSYKSRTCNPEWGEEFDLLCHDVEIQTVTLSVFDYDAVGSDDLMGMCELILTALPPHKKVPITLPLSEATQGEIMLEVEFTPLEGPHLKAHEEPEDVIESGDLVVPSIGGSIGRPISSKLGRVGVLTIMNLHLLDVKDGGTLIQIRLGNSVRTTEMIQIPKDGSGKGDAAFPDIFHVLVKNATGHTAIEVTVLHKSTGVTSKLTTATMGMISGDSEIGKIKVLLSEVEKNKNTVEREWPLVGEKITGSLGAKLTWVPAAKEKAD